MPTLHRITVNLTEKSNTALDHAATLTGSSKTDTVNKAVQLWDEVMTAQQNGENMYIRNPQTGELERIRYR